LSEQVETSLLNNLDVVRARIFYLASDVEPVSAPAAMLLRAVADAIDEGDSEQIAALKLNGASSVRPSDLRPAG
jgi:hypothetical protein